MNVLTGNIVQYNFYITSSNELKDSLYYEAKEYYESIENDINSIIKNTLGQEFEITELQIKKGSVEYIITIGTIYYAISKYKNFIDSLKLLKSQIETLLLKFHKRSNRSYTLKVNSILTLGGSVTNSKLKVSHINFNQKIFTILIYYLIFSHLILTLILIYYFIRR